MNWQPIETIPPDVEVLLYSSARKLMGIGYRVVLGDETRDQWIFNNTSAHRKTLDFQLSHWMPLPDAPQNEDTHSGQ